MSIKEIVCRRGDAVDLRNGTDAQQTSQHTEQGEQLCQPLPAGAHTIFNIVERTTQIVSFFVYCTIFDCQKAFGIFGRHTEQGCDLHPEQSTRTAGCDCRSNADDITGTDRCRQSRTESTKTGDFTLAFLFILDHEFQC